MLSVYCLLGAASILCTNSGQYLWGFALWATIVILMQRERYQQLKEVYEEKEDEDGA